jgi:hypothetical protein
MFYTAELKPSNDEVDKRLLLPDDDRTFLLEEAASALFLILASQNINSLARVMNYVSMIL